MITGKEQQKPMVENISCIIPETGQLGGLFLGNVYGAQNAQILKDVNNLGRDKYPIVDAEINHAFEDIPFYLSFQGHDKEDYYISEHVNDCIHFIEQNRKFTNVFVHCYAGVSRSSAIICAYVMWKYRWNLTRTLAFLTFKRIVVKPNDGFMKQLKDVEAKLNLSSQSAVTHSSKAQQILSPKRSRVDEEPRIQQRPSSNRQIQSHISRPQSPTVFQSKKMQPFAQLNQMQERPPQMNNSVPMEPRYSGAQYATRMEESTPNLQDKSVARNKNYSDVPIPRFLNRKSQYSKVEPRAEQSSRKSIYNDYLSPELQPTSPRNKLPPKHSMGKMKSPGIGLGSPNKPQDLNGFGYRDQQASVFSTNYSQKSYETMEKSKTLSRVLIRPKDLPGYKSGYQNY